MIKPSGPKDAKIAIVGESPGSEEDRVGIPFVGSSGKLLDRMLGLAGIQREDCYITNVMLVRPVKNDFGEFYYDKSRKQPRECLRDGITRLFEELIEVNPNIVIALGNEALKALTGQKEITKRRGSVYDISTEECHFKVMPTIHPAGLMRNWDYFPLVLCDLKKAKVEAEFPELKKLPRLFQVIETLPSLTKAVDSYVKSEYIAFDIETNNNQISCIGFSNSPSHAFTIPLCLYEKSFWSPEEEVIVWREIERLLTCSAKKLAQNANFDLFFIKKLLKIKVENFWLDTMNAWHCLTGETKIDTLQGAIPIKDLVGRDDVWVWSCLSDGTPVPAKASDIRLTQKKVDLIRVSYWYRGAPGEGLRRDYIDMTPDHRVRLLNGKWVEAKDLQPADSLTRLKLTYGEAGRKFIHLSRHGQIPVSQYVATCFNIEGEIIHHRDENPANDNPENLMGMSKREHNQKHNFYGWHPHTAWNKGKSKLDNYNVKEMYATGMSTKDIAEQVQMNISSIIYYMQRKGIKTRTLSQAQRLRRTSERNAKVISVETLSGKADVYNMEVDKYHCFSANHIIVHNCVYPELPKGLDTLTSILTDQPYYKDTITTEFYRYNCLDAMVTLECGLKIEEEMKEFGVNDFYHHHVHVLIDPLLDMQMRGVQIDKAKRTKAAESMKKDIEEKQKILNEAVGYELNVSSPKQMCDFLYKDLGLPTQYSKKSGGRTADEATLQKLSKRYPNKIFELVLEIRGLSKLVSTYLEASLDDDDRFRCSYLLTGAESGRLASRKSIYGTGGNLQNVPRGIAREVFIPDEGKMFISADLSQAEARVVAYLADEKKLIDALETGGDVHKRVASMMFNVPYEEVTTIQRELGKRIVHASNYGMGPRKFAELTGMSQSEAIEKMNLFHNTFPRIKMWHMSIESQLNKNRLLVTPMGRKRIFFGRWNDSMIRDAYSYIPQSTVADLTLRGMYQVYCNLPKDWELVFNIHDEVVLQAPIMEGAKLEEAIEKVKKWMTVPLEVNGKKLVIPVGVQCGMNWDEVH